MSVKVPSSIKSHNPIRLSPTCPIPSPLQIFYREGINWTGTLLPFW